MVPVLYNAAVKCASGICSYCNTNVIMMSGCREQIGYRAKNIAQGKFTTYITKTYLCRYQNSVRRYRYDKNLNRHTIE